MLVLAPLMKAEEDGAIGIDDLTEKIVAGRGLIQAQKRLVPPQARGHVADAKDGPKTCHGVPIQPEISRPAAPSRLGSRRPRPNLERLGIPVERHHVGAKPKAVAVVDVTVGHGNAVDERAVG